MKHNRTAAGLAIFAALVFAMAILGGCTTTNGPGIGAGLSFRLPGGIEIGITLDGDIERVERPVVSGYLIMDNLVTLNTGDIVLKSGAVPPKGRP